MYTTMMQLYKTKTKERARRLNDDICEAFAGSGHFKDNHLVVTPVEKFSSPEDTEPCYGFYVCFDTVKIEEDIQVEVFVDKHLKK